MKKKTFVIAGGGTGGHIYPGLALSESLKEKFPDCEIHFVGAEGGLEEKIVPKHGYPLHLLKIGRLHRSVGLWRRLKTLFKLPLSLIHSVWLYLKLRPTAILGVGGFASGPFVFVSSLLGGNTAVLEPNAFPGLANRYLAKWVKHCFVVFNETAIYFPEGKVTEVGLPVRIPKQEPRVSYQAQRPFRLLIFGGSQGARAINSVVGDWVESLGERSQGFEVLHQTGYRDFALWEKRYADKYQSFLTYQPYLDDMPKHLAWADLVICRAGIGSVAEVAMACKPTLFIPLPTAADNHQVKNAQVLVNRGGAKMLEEKELNSQTLNEIVVQLRSQPNELQEMASQLVSIDYSQAKEQIIAKLMES